MAHTLVFFILIQASIFYAMLSLFPVRHNVCGENDGLSYSNQTDVVTISASISNGLSKHP